MAKANVETRVKVVTVEREEQTVVIELSREEAIVLMGQLGKGNVMAHGLDWRQSVYLVLSEALKLSADEERLRRAHLMIDEAWREQGYGAAKDVAWRLGNIISK